MFAGQIGSCLHAREPARRAALEKAGALYGCLAAGKEYEALVLLAAYEKEKSAAIAVLNDVSALCAASLRSEAFRVPGQPAMPPARAACAVQKIGSAVRRLGANASPKLVLTLLAAELCQ